MPVEDTPAALLLGSGVVKDLATGRGVGAFFTDPQIHHANHIGVQEDGSFGFVTDRTARYSASGGSCAAARAAPLRSSPRAAPSVAQGTRLGWPAWCALRAPLRKVGA